MTERQFHLLLVIFALTIAGLMLFIDHPAPATLPKYLQPRPVVAASPNAPAPALVPPGLVWQDTPAGPILPPASAEPPLLDQWRNFPVHAAVCLSNARLFNNHLTLGPYGRVRYRLAPADRAKLWQIFCRLCRQSPDDLATLGLTAILDQAEQADQVAWLATSRSSFVQDAGSDLPAGWAAEEGSPRGALVWWVALHVPVESHPSSAAASLAAPLVPAGAFKKIADTDWPHTAGTPPISLYAAKADTLELYAAVVDRLVLLSPSREVLRRAILRRTPADPSPAPAPAASPVEDPGFREFRAHVAATPDVELHGYAEGELLALALEEAHVPEFYVQLAQARKCDRLLLDGRFRQQRIDLTASVEVPQHSVYDFIALDGPRQLDRFLPADLLGYADLRLNFAGMINYAVTLATQGYFGSKLQQTALLAGPLLTLSNLPSALGNELAAALAPAQDKTYLAWSFALPWRNPHNLGELVTIGNMAGAPFESPLVYRGETLITPKFKAKMEFRYPVLILVPDACNPPQGPPSPATPADPATPAAPSKTVPVKDSALVIAANGWNLPDVLDVKQGLHPNLAASPSFQADLQDNAGASAIQIYLNLSHGFGYAYVALLGELYGLPIGGVPLEEDHLPRSEAYGPMGHIWISLSRAKLPAPTDVAPADPVPTDPPKTGDKMSRLKFHLVWKME